ncbi:Uma2 family endonuclease [Crossiella equi]|uniref:Uma2 family endonuclease n=1 Tax=Crossiella equi TaxID=130796 RepID=A0ABS5ASQ0_9PSEU|nr:Uma2 family endonuclease [Crossiella equi]MBP2478705.1 Uma2 family endonuclease [Crossiella equi]
MSTALNDPMIGPHTVEDWLALDPPVDGSVVELIYGYLYMTPAPSGEHQTAMMNLAFLTRAAVRAAGRTDLHVVPEVNVRISTAWRTALIPDLVVLNRKAVGTYFDPRDVVLAVEIWSPANKLAERETKLAAYAGAEVPFVWTVEQPNDLHTVPTLTAYRLVDGKYQVEQKIEKTGAATITAAPVPVPIDLVELDS